MDKKLIRMFFFMPVGKYLIDIKKENLPVEVACKNGGQTVEVKFTFTRLI